MSFDFSARANKRRPASRLLAVISFLSSCNTDEKPAARNERRNQSDTAGQAPPPSRVSPCGESRAYRAADERRRQVDAIEPSARLRGESKNGPIAEDEIGAHPEVDRNRGSNQKRQRDDRACRTKIDPIAPQVAGRPQPRSAIRPPIGTAMAPETRYIRRPKGPPKRRLRRRVRDALRNLHQSNDNPRSQIQAPSLG
jgi:hypothetical protein